MGWLARLFDSSPIVTESRAQDLPDVTRSGFEYGIPFGGADTATRARSTGALRRQVMDELYQAYLSCPWVSTCADSIARLVTAGGLKLVPDEGDEEKTARPPVIMQLDQLMDFTNDREDIIQLCRSTVSDLLVFGDGFIEVGAVGQSIGALWTLDATTVTVMCDDHGVLSGYDQEIDGTRNTQFEPGQVIHVSLDSPRGGIYGVSPTQKLLVTVTTWLFAAACLKEYYRRGMPPRVALDLGKDTTPTDGERYRQQYQAKHLGPRNIGQPIITRTGAPGSNSQPPIKELGTDQITQSMDTMMRARDEIVSGFGMSPSMVGIVESGNLGGGTGESQWRVVHYGTVLPIQNLLLEKLNYHLLTARGVDGWHFEFGEVDYRDSKTLEDIRDVRLRDGAITLNAYRAEIGEEPVEGGDIAILVDRQNLVAWRDLPAFSKASVAKQEAGSNPNPMMLPPGLQGVQAPADTPAPGANADTKKTQDRAPKKETAPERHARELSEAWHKAYAEQRNRLNRELPRVDASE